MAEIDDLRAQFALLERRLSALDDALAHVAAKLTATTADVTELTHDITTGADLLGAILGEPFRSQARELISKRQT